jgi:hypothetical protein
MFNNHHVYYDYMIPGFSAERSLSDFSASSMKLVFSAGMNKYYQTTTTRNAGNYGKAMIPQLGSMWPNDWPNDWCIPGCVCFTGENCPCCGYGEILAGGPRKPVWW